MKKRKCSALLIAAMTALCLGSCEDWGQMDPPAANQTYPTLEQVASLTFDEADGEGLPYNLFAYDQGNVPDLIADESITGKAQNALHLDSGYVRMFNPMYGKTVQEGVSMTFFIRQAGPTEEQIALANGEEVPEGVLPYTQDVTSTLFKWENENGTQSLILDNNGGLTYDGVDGDFSINLPADVKTGILDDPAEWHYVALSVHSKGYFVYVDGKKRINETVTNFDMTKIGQFMANVPYLYIGYDGLKEGEKWLNINEEWCIDEINWYRNTITSTQTTDPRKPASAGEEINSNLIYFNNFENGANDATIKGGGAIIDGDIKFGKIFSNATGGMRSNYLVLPSDVLSHSVETQALSIGVWVNRGNETASSTYNWSPLFSAYGAEAESNGTPMLVCQYRGILQVNCNGWSDYTNEQNVKGKNGVYHNDTGADWLADGEWHYYTATFTPTTAKVYFDGKLVNEWVIDGTANTAAGLFSNGADLKHICLGGNQAWNWADPDPGFWFDDIAIYNIELNEAQIKGIINSKGSVYFNDFEFGVKDATVVGGGSILDTESAPYYNVFSNASGAMRTNYLLLPEDALSHSVETQATSIVVWVNRGNETASSAYNWSPLFTAYGAAPAADGTNTWPMLACQYRGVLQLNCAGWSDYTNEQNVKGANGVYHNDTGADWLADGEWHLYTATFTPTTAKVYFDGVLKNEWKLDGATNTAAGLFSNGADLKYICLGGNQAWNWGDPDPGFWFDDMAIYNRELSEDEILGIVKAKKQ